MSHPDNKSTGIVEHKKSRSVAVMSADGVGFEATDAPAKVVLFSLGIIAGLGVFAFALMFGYDKYLESQNPPSSLPSPLAKERIVPAAPQIQRLPWLDLPEMRAREREVLNSSGRDKAGHVHVPINQAMEAVASKINTQPGQPTGLLVPGGQDRAFSRTLADMPPAYQHPGQATLQGEIHKNAQ